MGRARAERPGRHRRGLIRGSARLPDDGGRAEAAPVRRTLCPRITDGAYHLHRPRTRPVPTTPTPTERGRTLGVGFFVKLILVGLADALGLYGVLTAWAIGQWAILISLVVILAVVNWAYFSRRARGSEVPRPGADLPVRLPDLRDGLHRVRRLHQLRRRSQLDQAGCDRADLRAERSARRRLADLPAGRARSRRSARLRDRRRRRSAARHLWPTARRGPQRHRRGRAGHGGPRVADADLRRDRPAAGRGRRPCEYPCPAIPPTVHSAPRTARRGSWPFPSCNTTRTPTRSSTRQTGPCTTSATPAISSRTTVTVLNPGWRVGVGFANFGTMITDPRMAGPFAQIFVWTFVFAFLSVVDHLPARHLPRDRVQRLARCADGRSTGRS